MSVVSRLPLATTWDGGGTTNVACKHVAGMGPSATVFSPPSIKPSFPSPGSDSFAVS